MTMIKVLIADDHPVVREGLKRIVQEIPNVTGVDEAENGQEVIEKARRNDYDVIILDMIMPGMTGLDILKQLKTENPKLPVLVLSMCPDDQYAIRALRAGAAGYLTKNKTPKELISAIQQVCSGKRYITPAIAEQLASCLGADSSNLPHEILSDREHQVMLMIASGMPVKVIAEELSLSVPTISTYRSRILEKMKMKNSAEITYYAIKQGLVD